ncbi:hypothetical protein SCLCIDRAFT_1212823 [Scleroderma citrinum Foug A]|uniref:Uncharacterized protein n=1 Tax=Scleroderma citrinum Foug A TaxID=1036808 RepID=A0A0C3DW11_9AGAM|nr:hypothetical protein SCLCIDRAFT_1212823 [Scleroderma citrinum Foug A]
MANSPSLRSIGLPDRSKVADHYGMLPEGTTNQSFKLSSSRTRLWRVAIATVRCPTRTVHSQQAGDKPADQTQHDAPGYTLDVSSGSVSRRKNGVYEMHLQFARTLTSNSVDRIQMRNDTLPLLR